MADKFCCDALDAVCKGGSQGLGFKNVREAREWDGLLHNFCPSVLFKILIISI
jgi:hypothetical protein